MSSEVVEATKPTEQLEEGEIQSGKDTRATYDACDVTEKAAW